MGREDYVLSFLSQLTEPTIRRFSDRLRQQKLVYLAEDMGAELGFTFGWYVNGPYSPSLTRTLYARATGEGRLNFEPQALRHDDTMVARRLRGFLGEKLDDPDYLELLASVWYHVPSGRVEQEQRTEIVNAVVGLKPHFAESDVRMALEKIIAFQNG